MKVAQDLPSVRVNQDKSQRAGGKEKNRVLISREASLGLTSWAVGSCTVSLWLLFPCPCFSPALFSFFLSLSSYQKAGSLTISSLTPTWTHAAVFSINSTADTRLRWPFRAPRVERCVFGLDCKSTRTYLSTDRLWESLEINMQNE